ncbi:adenine nucleotide alpha hydrolases-like superfamily protein [Actinidia rufa]|uniref:Adenine nucleotide alpha hydrolases-like superfamily protein n=1 Tax=Actinidia rufa TaxID=165716 RepID=A0A7J0GFX2_9ERIC|nr:adenine nucleotide alpha hydrolases-like superfamily protein [Actinidia rufa]
MTSSGSFLRQLSGREAWQSTSKRWATSERSSWKQMEGLNNINMGSEQSSSTSPYLASSLGLSARLVSLRNKKKCLLFSVIIFFFFSELGSGSRGIGDTGPKLATVVSQVKKLEVSVLVLGQKKPSALFNCLCGNSNTEEFVDQCINGVECLTIGVRKQSKGIGGYLISTRWQKNFWLLA